MAELPLEFGVRPGSRLYVYGRRIEHVELDGAPGDSLYLNGVAVMRHPWQGLSVFPHFTERGWKYHYGGIPFVRALVDSGLPVVEAAARFDRERVKLEATARDAFKAAIAAGESLHSAQVAALEALQESDRESLIDWQAENGVVDGLLVVHWSGWRDQRLRVQLDIPGSMYPAATYEDVKRSYATRLRIYVADREEPCWVFIHSSGTDVFNSEDTIAAVREQIGSAAATGEVTGYPLPKSAVRQLLGADQ